MIFLSTFSADGFSYEKDALEEWFERGKYTSPMTNLEISPDIIINSSLRERIEKYLHDADFSLFEVDREM